MLHGRNAGNSIHIGKFRLCKSAEKNCSEAGSYYSGLACPACAMWTEQTALCTRICRHAVHLFGDSPTYTYSKMLNVHFEQASLSTTNTLSKTELHAHFYSSGGLSLPFERKRKRKRPGGIFRVSPWEPQNSSYPPQAKDKAKDKAKRTVRPLI